MASSKTLNVKVYNQAGTVFEGAVQVLFVPGKKDEVAILPEHTPLIMLLTAGPVQVVAGGAKKSIATIKHGIIYVGQNEASVLINDAA
jgi:F-type H+-transporting ATPase subunit epsilon